MGKWRAFAQFGEGKGSDGVEAVGERAAERNVFSGGGKEVGVVGEELAGEVLPAFGAGRIVLAEESTPPEAVVVEGVGVVVVDRLVGSIAKPAVADGHRFECVEPLADLRCIGFLPKTFFFENDEPFFLKYLTFNPYKNLNLGNSANFFAILKKIIDFIF